MVKKKFASAAMQTKHIFFLALRREGGYKVDLAWHFDSVHLIWTKFGMDIPLDHRNNPVEAFFIFLKSKMAAGGQNFATRYNFSMFLQQFGSGSSDLDKIWHGHTT